jgi:Ran-binding protein 1
MDKECDPPEWKERGVGDVRILKHKDKMRFRIVMRRDKTHKICCNHFITPEIKLVPNVGSDRAWVWSTLADYADEEVKREQLAIRFGNAENAKKFKEMVEKCQVEIASFEGSTNDSSLAEELEKLDVKDESKTEEDVDKTNEPKEEAKQEVEDNAEDTKPEDKNPPAPEDQTRETDECTGQ